MTTDLREAAIITELVESHREYQRAWEEHRKAEDRYRDQSERKEKALIAANSMVGANVRRRLIAREGTQLLIEFRDGWKTPTVTAFDLEGNEVRL